MFFLSEQARSTLVASIPEFIERSELITELRLWNLGITVDEGTQIL